jgi:hypothetical protein
MNFNYRNWLNVAKTTAASRWRNNSARGCLIMVLFSANLLGACEVYNADLIADQKGEIKEPPPLSTLEDPNQRERANASIGGDAGLTNEQTEQSIAAHEFDPSCVPNPDGDEFCPWICDEVCDNQDNDCDGEIDEAEADATCELANAIAECSQGVCAIKACFNGFDDCDEEDVNGCETSLNTLSDCGSCGNECVGVSCRSGRCSELECEEDTADCDGETENGCETTLGTNTDCGFCGDACPELPDADFPHASAAGCFEYECRISQCEQGHRDCNNIYNDGCETDVANDENNCGECGLSCRALPNVQEASCQNGVCAVDRCQSGYLDTNDAASDGCEAQSANPASPEPGCRFETHAEHIYYFCSSARNWSEAYDNCSDAGLYLVRINDAAENTFIDSNISDDHWIGASDLETEGVWIWTVDHERFWTRNPGNPSNISAQGPFVNWAPGEPNNNNESDCARISASENGRWKDKECDSLYGYVCEGDHYYEPCTNPGLCETSVGATRGADGVCRYPANPGGSCNDGDPCTHTDRCQTDKSCAGIQYTCDNPGFCETTEEATCNGNGTCTYLAAQDGRCDDDDPCTHTDRCQADKSCAGTPYNCDNPGFCETAENATCNGDGTCTYPANVGEACDDENPCTENDQCLEDRSCEGTAIEGAECDDENDCTEDDDESCDDDDDQGEDEQNDDEEGDDEE